MYSTEQGQNQTEQPAESFDLFVFASWEVFQTSDRTRKIRGREWFQRVGDIFWDTSLNLRGKGTCFTMVSSQSSLFECVDIYKFIHATSAEMNYSYHSIWTATCFQRMQRSRCTSMCDTGHVRQCTTTLCKHTTSQYIVLNFEASPWWRNISVLRANSGLHHMVKHRRQWPAKPMRQIGSLD